MSQKTRRAIPNYRLPIIETHCHLDSLDLDLDELLSQCAELGIERLITIAVEPSNQQTVADLTRHPMIYATQGIHPHDADSYSDAVEALMRSNLSNQKIVAIGEIGLDYYYDHSDRAVQRQVFARQLALALAYKLPIVIHTRDADADTEAILREYVPALTANDTPLGVIHSFTSGIALAQYCLAVGFKIGFNGICTFNNASNVREIIQLTPLNQILLETDSPYLTPVPYRGRPNAPIYLPFIAEQIAKVKAISVEAVLRACYQNSLETFFSAASMPQTPAQSSQQ